MLGIVTEDKGCCEAADLCNAAVQSAETAETAATEDMEDEEVVRLLGLDPGGAEAKHSLVEATETIGGEPLATEVLNELLDGLEEEVTFISCCCCGLLW